MSSDNDDKKPPSPAELELGEPSLTVYEPKPIEFPEDPTPTEMLPPAPTHEKSDLGRALADVELRDLTITHLHREVVTLRSDVERLRDKVAEMVVVENAQAVEIDALKEKLASALDDRAALAARLKAALK